MSHDVYNRDAIEVLCSSIGFGLLKDRLHITVPFTVTAIIKCIFDADELLRSVCLARMRAAALIHKMDIFA